MNTEFIPPTRVLPRDQEGQVLHRGISDASVCTLADSALWSSDRVHHDNPVATLEERINDLCGCFERAWLAGGRPGLEDYFNQWGAGPGRAFLLWKLLRLDLYYRCQVGDCPLAKEYIKRFPDHTRLIATLFAEDSFVTQYFGEGGEPDPSSGTTRESGNEPIADPSSSTSSPPLPMRYRLVRFHARGGLGEVMVAHDEELNRQVALKRLPSKLSWNARHQRRFLLEAEVTARLEHPGVVPVYGLVQDGRGQPSYAMRLIQGETLEVGISRFHGSEAAGKHQPSTGGERRLELRQLLHRFNVVCATVAYAHSRGVLHCDLKPANIMLGKYGETLVVDWGLARLFDRTGVSGAELESTLRPHSDHGEDEPRMGEPSGTASFMSPEQAVGHWNRVGPASDIYSLGATLYTLLTGQSPFHGATVWDILDDVVGGRFLPPRQVNRDVPPELEAICLKAMAYLPEERYASPLALADDIERWLGHEPVTVYQRSWPRRWAPWLSWQSLLTVGVAVASLVLGAALGMIVW
jgi:serine/threonine protein kinase